MQIDEMLHDLRAAVGREQASADRMTRVLYSTDASNYQVMPLAVTFPRDADDVVAVHEVARKHGVPVLPRGGGSALAGQAVGEAIIMDSTRHMRRVRGVNAEARTVDVEPGMILGTLNGQLAGLDLMFGPDPASAERAAIGGVIGNNATGAHSIRYGMTADHVARLQVVTANGDLVWLDESSAELNQLRSTVADLAIEHAPLIEARYPKTWRTVAGYALDKIDPDDVNLNWLLCGSEGTLATVVRAELRLVERPKMEQKRLALVHFDTLRDSLEATPRILELEPAAIELMDKFLLDKTRAAAGYRDRLTFVDGDPEAILLVEFVGSARELSAKIDDLKAHLARLGYRGALTVAETAAQQDDVWTVRKAGLGLMMSERSEAKPVSFIEDGAVPVESLADYITDVERDHLRQRHHLRHLRACQRRLPAYSPTDQSQDAQRPRSVSQYRRCGGADGQEVSGHDHRRAWTGFSAQRVQRIPLRSRVDGCLPHGQTRLRPGEYDESGQDHRCAADGQRGDDALFA